MVALKVNDLSFPLPTHCAFMFHSSQFCESNPHARRTTAQFSNHTCTSTNAYANTTAGTLLLQLIHEHMESQDACNALLRNASSATRSVTTQATVDSHANKATANSSLAAIQQDASSFSVPTIPPATIPPGTDAEGRVTYVDLRPIGRGGFGEVFKGRVDYENGQQMIYALKRALPHSEAAADIEQYLQRLIHQLDSLRREARVYFSPVLNTGACQHLALLFDVAQVRNSDGDREPLLVLQYADAPQSDLRSWLHCHRDDIDVSITLRERLSFAVQMCAGLQELHYGTGADQSGSHGDHDGPTKLDDKTGSTPLFVHQDLKPGNMLLFGRGANIRLALTDFGLAASYNTDAVHASRVHGTPTYMAPEQWLGQQAISPERDMWAAGMVLTQLFGGPKTRQAMKLYRSFIQRVVATKRKEKIPTKRKKFLEQATGKMYILAKKIADAMAVDAKPSRYERQDEPTAISQVRAEVQLILRECFAKVLTTAESQSSRKGFSKPLQTLCGASMARIDSGACARRFVSLWDKLYPQQPWKDFWSALPAPRTSPLAQVFTAAERRGTYYRLVEGGMLKLMLSRCDAVLRTAEKSRECMTVRRWLADTVRPHLQKRLRDVLGMACECFEEALLEAKTTTCTQCGRRGDGDAPLRECPNCRVVRFCNLECETKYFRSVIGMGHKGSDCQFLASCAREGCIADGITQVTELALLRGEVWEVAGRMEGTEEERNKVLAQFKQAQMAWQCVYVSGPNGAFWDKYRRGIASGVTRYTGSVTDCHSPMIQACERGLTVLLQSVLDAAAAGNEQILWNHAEPNGQTPLCMACHAGHAMIVSLLLDKGRGTIDVNQATKEVGATPLYIACQVCQWKWLQCHP